MVFDLVYDIKKNVCVKIGKRELEILGIICVFI